MLLIEVLSDFLWLLVDSGVLVTCRGRPERLAQRNRVGILFCRGRPEALTFCFSFRCRRDQACECERTAFRESFENTPSIVVTIVSGRSSSSACLPSLSGMSLSLSGMSLSCLYDDQRNHAESFIATWFANDWQQEDHAQLNDSSVKHQVVWVFQDVPRSNVSGKAWSILECGRHIETRNQDVQSHDGWGMKWLFSTHDRKIEPQE